MSERYEADTFNEFYRLADECSPKVGIHVIPMKQYHSGSLEEAGIINSVHPQVWFHDLVPDVRMEQNKCIKRFIINTLQFKVLSKNELIPGAQSGIEYKSVCLNTPVGSFISNLRAY